MDGKEMLKKRLFRGRKKTNGKQLRIFLQNACDNAPKNGTI